MLPAQLRIPIPALVGDVGYGIELVSFDHPRSCIQFGKLPINACTMIYPPPANSNGIYSPARVVKVVLRQISLYSLANYYRKYIADDVK